ncbi:hypothetical protein SAMN06272781_7055 [Streptomyces sp. 1222.2]|nr:hypothetical protein SAMN06272781_7055 [Streptomyces sp. 1222.2]
MLAGLPQVPAGLPQGSASQPRFSSSGAAVSGRAYGLPVTRSLQAVACTRPSVLESVAGGLRLGLETSRGATPTGVRDHPRFFSGFLTSPQVAAAGLAHGEPPHLAEAADRRGSSRWVTRARRLRAAPEEPPAA